MIYWPTLPKLLTDTDDDGTVKNKVKDFIKNKTWEAAIGYSMRKIYHV